MSIKKVYPEDKVVVFVFQTYYIVGKVADMRKTVMLVRQPRQLRVSQKLSVQQKPTGLLQLNMDTFLTCAEKDEMHLNSSGGYYYADVKLKALYGKVLAEEEFKKQTQKLVMPQMPLESPEIPGYRPEQNN